jgi:hypothetical protein
VTDLLQTYALLASGLRDDPLLCLASTVVWLDPMWQDADEDWDGPHDEDGTLGIALMVTRKAFPDVYIEAIQAIRQGTSYADLDRLICTAISAHGIPLENLEWIGFGIPLPAYGAVLDDPEFYTVHPDTKPVLECFGISPEPNPYHIDVPEYAYTAGQFIATDLQRHDDERFRQIGWLMHWLFSSSGNSSVLCGIKNTKSSETFGLDEAYTIGRLIADDLENHSDKCYQQVSWLLKWLFSSTNNSCVDWTAEEMDSMEPLAWTPEDVAFAIEIIQEADTIMADAMSGLQWLIQTPQILLALWQNVTQVQRALAKEAKKTRLGLTWPDPTALLPLTLPEYLLVQSS